MAQTALSTHDWGWWFSGAGRWEDQPRPVSALV